MYICMFVYIYIYIYITNRWQNWHMDVLLGTFHQGTTFEVFLLKLNI